MPATRGQFGGLDLPDARCRKALEHENARLKRFLAKAELDKAVQKHLPGNG